jgi:cytochrome c-type biogenesis protein CcmH
MRRFLTGPYAFLVALVVVIAVAIAAAPSTPSDQQRIASLESLVRCPACEDLSVAQSNAASSIAVRHQIEQDVHGGMSDGQIIAALESAYGTNILLSPRGSTLDALLWVVPVACVAAGVVVVVRVVRRRS